MIVLIDILDYSSQLKNKETNLKISQFFKQFKYFDTLFKNEHMKEEIENFSQEIEFKDLERKLNEISKFCTIEKKSHQFSMEITQKDHSFLENLSKHLKEIIEKEKNDIAIIEKQKEESVQTLTSFRKQLEQLKEKEESL